MDVDPPPPGDGAEELALARLPGSVLSYLQSSRYREGGDVLRIRAQRFGGIRARYDRVTFICD